jgi:glycosyltransferase involved in cell wall biosynthesis
VVEKVLIVVSSFPSNGGSRVEKFVKYLPDFGFEPVVLSAREASSPLSREQLDRTYSPGLKSFQARSLGWTYFAERFLDRGPQRRYYSLLRLLSFPERLIYVPDYMVRWVPFGLRLARHLVKTEGISLTLTSSPPESTHLIGLYLRRKLGLRWVADFRDLWTESKMLYRPATPLHDRWIGRLERTIFHRADHIIANTPDNLTHYLRRFDLPENRVSLIPNGFDRDDLGGIERLQRKDDVFQIGHMGNLDKQSYPWRPFFIAMRMLADAVGWDKVRFVHCGFYSPEVSDFLRRQDMVELMINHGLLSHREAMAATAVTTVRLLLLDEPEAGSSVAPSKVPGKLYSYLIMDGPIVAIAPEKGDVARMMAATRMGTVISPHRGPEGIYSVLRAYFDRWACGELRLRSDDEQIARYDRRSQTRQLAEILRQL